MHIKFQISKIFGAILIACGYLTASGQMTGVDDLVFVDEDSQVVIDVQANDINLGIDPLVTEYLTYPEFGILELLSVDSFRYTPNINFNGIDTFSYRVCNSDEPIPSCDEALVIITVVPTPDYPIAVNDFADTYIQQPIHIDVQLNDINFDAESLVTSIIEFPSSGTASVTFSDSIFFNPGIGYTGADSIKYSVCKIGSSIFCDTALAYVNVFQTNFFPPIAVDDYYVLDIGSESVLDILVNDSDGDGDSIALTEIMSGLVSGLASINDGDLVYLAVTPGTDSVKYVICDDNIPVLCDTGIAVIEVLDIQIPDSFSPNGDGFNELFDISGLEAYPGFTFTIFNRWGQKVFTTSEAHFKWRGEVTEPSALPSGDVVDGTYFYILELNNGFPPISGTIFILR